jgi:hypothetical protein
MANKGRGKDDGVVEAISPGGHVMKRRARSRPVSQELLESEFPPFTIADSGNCLSANSIFTITDCLTIQIDMTSARTMANRNADPISLPSLMSSQDSRKLAHGEALELDGRWRREASSQLRVVSRWHR